jgi:hypothetical protein
MSNPKQSKGRRTLKAKRSPSPPPVTSVLTRHQAPSNSTRDDTPLLFLGKTSGGNQSKATTFRATTEVTDQCSSLQCNSSVHRSNAIHVVPCKAWWTIRQNLNHFTGLPPFSPGRDFDTPPGLLTPPLSLFICQQTLMAPPTVGSHLYLHIYLWQKWLIIRFFTWKRQFYHSNNILWLLQRTTYLAINGLERLS